MTKIDAFSAIALSTEMARWSAWPSTARATCRYKIGPERPDYTGIKVGKCRPLPVTTSKYLQDINKLRTPSQLWLSLTA